MRIVKPQIILEEGIDGAAILRKIEKAGRTCYKSEDRIEAGSAEKFVRMIIKRGHLSVLEHAIVTVRIICDRGVSHELVRHRIASYSQESTRYCDYGSGHVQFIMPPFYGDDVPASRDEWLQSMAEAEGAYKRLLACGESPQIARSVLPNSLKTEIVVTMNLREWRHFFTLRCAPAAHPQMRGIACWIHGKLTLEIPVVFEGLIQ